MRCSLITASLTAVAVLLNPAVAVSASNGTTSNGTTPMQIRLAYAGPTGMTISWNTYSQLKGPSVRYGRAPWALTQIASSNVSITYPTSTTYNNHVTLTGLEPDTLYFYQPAHSNSSVPYTFKTSRSAGEQTPYTIAVAVDLGLMGPDGLTTRVGKGADNPLGPNDTNTMQSIEKNLDGIDFLWHRTFWLSYRMLTLTNSCLTAGDIAYADYWLKEEIQGFLPNTTIADGYKVYESLLNQFYDEMTPITSRKPYMVGPGNHEANCM
jgi:hypothetical protein